MNEFGGGRREERVQTGHGSIYLSRELQELQIEQVVNLLMHTNPYTALTYAQDPAIVCVELFNEDSALFFGTMKVMQTVPTLRTRAAQQFSVWLRARYGSEAALRKAWGPRALNSFGNEGFANESLAAGTIVPAGNPWFYDPDQLAGSQSNKVARLHDTMLFWYEVQNAFYRRYVAAIRKTGYTGEILASNWQAGRQFSHYYNLHSDYLVGMIDRHNYFSGERSMLDTPGGGMLSAGMQQVADRPFMLSEWIHVFPSEWGVEGPAIIGAYGMGLNGWDVSYMFQNRDEGRFSARLGAERWDVMAPQVLGVFPAVARQVLRGDVREASVTAARYVHVPSLHRGRLSFGEQTEQEHDVKVFDSATVPARALAVVRSVVEFTDEYRATPAFDITPYQSNGVLVSSTGQLQWHTGTGAFSGYFTMDTPGTKALVGFAEGVSVSLGEVTITSSSRFSAVYVTAAEKGRTLADSTNILVVALARARNAEMPRGAREGGGRGAGRGPVRMEPVHALVALRGRAVQRVVKLNHNGAETGEHLESADGVFAINGARDKTPYYLVQCEVSDEQTGGGDSAGGERDHAGAREGDAGAAVPER